MARLVVVIVLVLYGLYAGVNFYFRSGVLTRVRTAVRAHGEFDEDRVDATLSRLRAEGGDNAVDVLVEMIHDKRLDLMERRMAQRALSHYADDSRYDKLARSARVSEALAFDLRVPVEDLDGEMLVGFLRSPDPAYRMAGCEGLAARADDAPGEVPALLLEVFRKDPYAPVRAVAAAAIGELGSHDAIEPLATAAREAPGALGRAAIEALSRIGGGAARKELEGLLPTHPVAAARGLARLGDRAATGALAEAMRTEDGAAALAAARALAVLDDDRGVEALRKALAAGTTEERRMAAEAAAGVVRDMLVEALVAGTTDPEPSVRIASARALGRTRHPRSVGALKALLTDRDLDVRVAAVRAMGDNGDPALYSTIRDQIAYGEDRICEAAIEAAVRNRDGNVVRTLEKIFHTSGTRADFVRKAAWLGLKELTGRAPELAEEDRQLVAPRELPSG